MSSVIASPTSAWTTGQRTPPLGDASTAHWSGSAWVTGSALAAKTNGSNGK